MATESSMFFRFSCRSNFNSFSGRKQEWTGSLGPYATLLCLLLSQMGTYIALRGRRVPSQLLHLSIKMTVLDLPRFSQPFGYRSWPKGIPPRNAAQPFLFKRSES